jgi:hypothetical protein
MSCLEGSKLIRVRWAVILIVLALLAPTGIYGSDGEPLSTTFFGSVTDIDTGAPIVNASIYFNNDTNEDFFFGKTDEGGLYSVQVGTGGNYEMVVLHPSYEFVLRSSEILTWEDKQLDIKMGHYANNCNVRVLKGSRNLFFKDAIVDLTEDVPNGSTYSVRADEDGWANITVPFGNYTMTAHAPHYQAAIRSIHVSADNYVVDILHIGPSSVGSDAPMTFSDESYRIPVRSALVIGITTAEEYSLYIKWRSDLNVDTYTVPGDRLDSFMEWGKAGSLKNDTVFRYDFAITGGRNGGMSCSTWTDPYYIVIINNESDPTNVKVTLKYEYGTFDLIEPSFISLDKEENGDLRWIEIMAGPGIAAYFLLMIGLIIIIVYFGIRRDRKENATQRSDPRYGRRVGRRSSRSRDRTSPPYRFDGDRSSR